MKHCGCLLALTKEAPEDKVAQLGHRLACKASSRELGKGAGEERLLEKLSGGYADSICSQNDQTRVNSTVSCCGLKRCRYK